MTSRRRGNRRKRANTFTEEEFIDEDESQPSHEDSHEFEFPADGESNESDDQTSSGKEETRSAGTGSARSRSNRSPYDRLPNNIPVFSGITADYLAWISSFKALILEERHTARQKMAALINSTKTVKNLTAIGLYPCNEDGLKEALQYLEEIYGNKMQIVDSAVANLERARPVRGMDLETIIELRALFISASTSARLVGRLTEYQERLKRAVMTKIPMRLQLEVKNHESSEVIQLKTIEEVLAREMKRTQELVQYDTRTMQPETRKRPNREVSSHAFKMQIREYTCPFDGDKHRFRDCRMSVADRLDSVRKQNRCMNCLGVGHRANECFSARKCSTCGDKHHTYLCQKDPNRTGGSLFDGNSDVQAQSSQISNETDVAVKKLFTPLCYKTLTARIKGQVVRILFDEGAGDNFITQAAVLRLKLITNEGPILNIFGFGSSQATKSAQYVTVSLAGQRKPVSIRTTLCVVPSLGDGSYPTPEPKIMQFVSTEQRRWYADDSSLPIEIIIGLTNSQTWLASSVLLFNDHRGTFSAQLSVLGTLVYGGKGTDRGPQVKMIFTPEEVVQEVERASVPEVDHYVDQFIEANVREVTGRIEVKIPLSQKFNLASNEEKSYRRMVNSVKRWTKNSTLSVVVTILDEWKQQHIIEPVTVANPVRHVLSYHVVTKMESTTTKHRLVFNGSLEDSCGRTLNDQLFKGHTTWNLIRSFMEFRRNRVPLVGDLRKAFLMVQISESDRDLFQFYWPDPTERKLYRFARVPFGTSASPFLLYAAICKIIQIQAKNFPCLETLINWFYVDDIVCSFDSDKEKTDIQLACDTVMMKYGFKIGWTEATEMETSKVLGLDWNTRKDTLAVRIGDLSLPQTVRQFASLIPSLFDPCGYIEPITAALRRTFSDVWKGTRDWNAKIPEVYLPEIDKLIVYLQSQSFMIPRWLGTDSSSQLIFHVFSDANDRSIGTSVYVQTSADGRLLLALAKALLHTRRTIAEAELDAIILAIDLVERKLGRYVGSIHLWTDSLINYHRLCVQSVNQLKYQQARKVMMSWEILSKYTTHIGHVVSKGNPADLLTKFETKGFRWNDWIERDVPTAGEFYTHFNHIRQSVEPDEDQHTVVEFLDITKTLTDCLERYSLNRLIIATQGLKWKSELHALKTHKPLPQKSSLGLYWYEMDNDILRAKLRTDDQRTRIVLPEGCRLAELLCQHIHETRGHAGADSVHKLFAQDYLCKGSRKIVRWITGRCAICRRLRRHPQSPPSAPLQTFRLNPPERPFQYVGVDFAGPLHTADGPRFILLFHCFHSRAILLKLLSEQTTNGVLHALKQLSARYGMPNFLYSDNAPVFRRGEKILKTLYGHRNAAIKLLNWKFSFPGDPQSNGATEVMVGLTKKYLRNISFGKSYTALELETYLSEAECGLNNRPLYVYEQEVVTPQHFLSGHTILPVPQPDLPVPSHFKERSPWTVRRRVNSFWASWKEGYLFNMREQQLGRREDTLNVGDTVIYEPMKICDRALWPTGIVIRVHPGTDGTVRLVDLKMASGKVEERRPIRKLILLERYSSRAEAASPEREEVD